MHAKIELRGSVCVFGGRDNETQVVGVWLSVGEQEECVTKVRRVVRKSNVSIRLFGNRVYC